jgi:two-component system chemotaxis response regulator CheB
VRYDIVVVGTSLGGLRALEIILSGLTAAFPLPVAVVQHRSKVSDELLVTLLQGYTVLRVVEAEDRQEIRPGHVYIAPADYHLMIDAGHFSLSTDGPVSYARPSIDVLFESAADAYGGSVIALVLTGANADGAAGAARIKSRGGRVLVQDPIDADSGVMPRASLQATPVDEVLPLADIAPRLNALAAT